MVGLTGALGLTDGMLLAAVGAGGKKSLLYRLAAELDPVIVTATVHIPEFDDHVDTRHVTDDPRATLAADEVTGRVGLVAARAPPDRFEGYPSPVVDDLHDETDVSLLVKADGARMRRFKAPGDEEPVVPASADVVAPVAGVTAVGQPLDESLVHRVDRVAALTGRAIGEPIRAEDVATVIAHPAGGLKGVPEDARVVPVLNMVDDDALAATAREIADSILRRSDRIDRVALTCLVAEDPVVDVHP
jgi:probable selenium-dependent hydroxylase accessory protein YqeC